MIKKTNILKTLFLFVLLALAVHVHAQSSGNRHNIVLWGSAGYSNLLNDAVAVRSSGGIGAAIGVGYEWHRNRFMLQTGAEFNLHNSKLALDDFIAYFDMLDSDNPREEYIGIFEYSGSMDKYTMSYVNVPLMLGFQWERFYFLAGAKAGFNIQATSQVTTTLETAGLYFDAIEPFRNIPGRFYTREVEENPNSLKLGLNTVASAELGFYLGDRATKNKTRYRLAVFCDYGLMNIDLNKPKENLLLIEPYISHQPVMNSFVKSDIFRNSHLNTFYAGVKFTVVFGLRERQNCLWILCD